MATYPEDLTPHPKCPKCGELIWQKSAQGAHCDDRSVCCKKCGQWFTVNYYELYITEEAEAPPEASVTEHGVGCPECGGLLDHSFAARLAAECRPFVCPMCGVTFHVEASTALVTRRADDALQVHKKG